MLSKKKLHLFVLTLTLLPFMAVVIWHLSQATAAAQTRQDSKGVSDLLDQAKAQAVQLKNDARDMESFSHQNLSWETHVDKINSIKDDVNRVGKTVAKLNASKDEASAWQKTVIERINPLLTELADNTTSIIDHLNRERGRLLNEPEHKELLTDNADLATELSATITDFVEYGKTRAKFYELRDKLELSEHAPGE